MVVPKANIIRIKPAQALALGLKAKPPTNVGKLPVRWLLGTNSKCKSSRNQWILARKGERHLLNQQTHLLPFLPQVWPWKGGRKMRRRMGEKRELLSEAAAGRDLEHPKSLILWDRAELALPP